MTETPPELEGLLTIAIPTYNRPEQLKRCLLALIPQLTRECRLLISDNHSEIPAETLACPILENLGWKQFHIHRHAFNKGAHGNLHHCFESATTEWLWVLGDDDVPAHDAVQTLLTSIQTHSDALALTYEVTEFRQIMGSPAPRQEACFAELAEYLGSDALYCSGLISSLVLNVPRARTGIIKGYEFGSSFFPHLAWIIHAMQNQRGRIIYSPRSIVTFAADGASESPLDPILPNLRYLTRMVASDEARALFMSNSYMRALVRPWYKRLLSPGFHQITLATSFRRHPKARSLLRRARRLCAESIEFDQIASPMPLAGALMCGQLLAAVCLGYVCGPLIRMLYRLKNSKLEVPTLLNHPQQPLVP